MSIMGNYGIIDNLKVATTYNAQNQSNEVMWVIKRKVWVGKTK